MNQKLGGISKKEIIIFKARLVQLLTMTIKLKNKNFSRNKSKKFS